MNDLNDFAYFHAVVTHQGFSAAARHIGVPKGTLSKRIARLEDRLQVRLLERSTRRLRTTDVGRAVFEQCELMMASYEAAEGVVLDARAEPNGLIRISCPQGLVQNLIGGMLRRFMVAYPKVRIQLKELNRPADLVEDGVDVALRARTVVEADASSVVRKFGLSRRVLTIGRSMNEALDGQLALEHLAMLPTLAMAEEENLWSLCGPDDEMHQVPIKPRLLCSDFEELRRAAREGLGIALLPEHICRDDLAAGDLVRVLPQWHTMDGTIYAVFSSRRGLTPAIRALIDFLVDEFKGQVTNLEL
ncbi:LysR substrate-binding domain-containing protein [Xanthomonas hortorum]|uniref:LysR substrate-binding domain-containing protein n=1 Tax=Xanthomonas hortorum TaxID=56454 RepID=UPI001593E023|nr:LysR substrate-binding domain-containing protein [Xanthomonas hortorum]NHF65600.1 LysR family transcriptional regulator [Xanthomonas hortorum]